MWVAQIGDHLFYQGNMSQSQQASKKSGEPLGQPICLVGIKQRALVDGRRAVVASESGGPGHCCRRQLCVRLLVAQLQVPPYSQFVSATPAPNQAVL